MAEHPLLASRVTQCDHCANSLPSSGAIVSDLGVMTVPMNRVHFCSKICQTAMIGNMLSSPHVGDAQKTHIKRVAPGAAAAYQRSIQSSIVESGVGAKGAAPIGAPIGAPSSSNAATPAKPIEAEFLTHVKRTLTHDHFSVDSVSMAEDLIRRIDYHRHHHHAGDTAHMGEPAEQGAKVWAHAMEKFTAEGGKDVALADQAFHTTLQNVMGLENESRPYWTHTGHDLHNLVHWHEDELAHDIGILMRSVMNPTIGGADYVKLDMILQKAVHRVIQERGAEGYDFLEAFFGGSGGGGAAATAEEQPEAEDQAPEEAQQQQ